MSSNLATKPAPTPQVPRTNIPKRPRDIIRPMTRRQFRDFIAPVYTPESTFPAYIEWTPKKIRTLRTFLHVSQEVFGLMAGVSMQTILAWENDQRKKLNELGVRKMQSIHNEHLNPLYQAFIDNAIPWTTVVGDGTQHTSPRLQRVIRLGSPTGKLRVQTGTEFRRTLIPGDYSEIQYNTNSWDHLDRYVRSGEFWPDEDKYWDTVLEVN